MATDPESGTSVVVNLAIDPDLVAQAHRLGKLTNRATIARVVQTL